MCIVLDGSTQFLTAAAAVVTAYPFSLWIKFNPTLVTVADYLFSSDNSASAAVNGYRMRAAGEVALDPIRGTTGDGSVADAYSTSTSFVAGVWQNATLVATSNVSRLVRLDNGGVATTATNITPTGLNRTLIGATQLLTVVSGWFGGSLAHAAIWDVALTTLDQAKLQAGYSPRLVQTPNLKAYLPFFTSIADLYGSTPWSAQGSPTFGADPPIKYNNNMMTMGMV